MKKMFNINGLDVVGTDEQIEKYASDSKEFDYVKNSLERIMKKANASEKDEFVKYVTIKRGLHLCVLGAIDNNKNRASNLLVYDSINNRYRSEIEVDVLIGLKSEKYMESALIRASSNQSNMVSVDIEKQAYDMLKVLNSKSEQIPEPIGKLTKILTSKKGFYIGDPTLVLKDEILNNGVRINSKVNTGLYNIGGVKMFITSSLNGCHSGHDIYSKTIGVIPIELLDKNKVKSLPYDSLDIRLGKSIKTNAENGNLYVYQGTVDVIDLKTPDNEYAEGPGMHFEK